MGSGVVTPEGVAGPKQTQLLLLASISTPCLVTPGGGVGMAVAGGWVDGHFFLAPITIPFLSLPEVQGVRMGCWQGAVARETRLHPTKVETALTKVESSLLISLLFSAKFIVFVGFAPRQGI